MSGGTGEKRPSAMTAKRTGKMPIKAPKLPKRGNKFSRKA